MLSNKHNSNRCNRSCSRSKIWQCITALQHMARKQPLLLATCLPTPSQMVLTTSISTFNSNTSSICIRSVCEASLHKAVCYPNKSSMAIMASSTIIFKLIAIKICSRLSCPLAQSTSILLSVVTAWSRSSPQILTCSTTRPSNSSWDNRLHLTTCCLSKSFSILVGKTSKKDWRALRIWPFSLSRPTLNR